MICFLFFIQPILLQETNTVMRCITLSRSCYAYFSDRWISDVTTDLASVTRIAFKKASNGSFSILLTESFFLSIHTATPSLSRFMSKRILFCRMKAYK